MTKITRITVICSIYSENYGDEMIRKQLSVSYTISTDHKHSFPLVVHPKRTNAFLVARAKKPDSLCSKLTLTLEENNW